MIVILGHMSELARDGDFICMPWDTSHEVAVVNDAGAVYAFDNLCPHRGARIFTELRGNRKPRCIYHGRLVTPGTAKRLPLQRWGDWLVACAPTFEPHADLTEFLLGAGALTPHSILSFVMDCPWQVAVENALDFEHVAHVHAQSLAKMDLRKKALQMYACGSSIEEFTAGMNLKRMGPFFAHVPQFDYVHAHFFPHSCLSSTKGWTFSLQNYFPRGEGKTTFVHRLYTAPTKRAIAPFFASVAAMNEKVFREDGEVCARVRAATGSLGPHEARLAHFRKFTPQ